MLGQAGSVAGDLIDLYAVPEDRACTVSSLVACNRNTATGSFRVAVAVAGAPDSPGQYLYFDQEVDGNSTFVATIGLTLAQFDVIRVQANTSQFTFNVFGIEVI